MNFGQHRKPRVVSRRLSYEVPSEPALVTVLVTGTLAGGPGKALQHKAGRAARQCCSPISATRPTRRMSTRGNLNATRLVRPRPTRRPQLETTRGQVIREGKDTKDRSPVRVSFKILTISPGQPVFEDTEDTEDSSCTRPVEAVPLVDGPGAV
jgi:hypothetical protein